MRTFPHKLLQPLMVLAVFAAFLPALTTVYGHSDDYTYLQNARMDPGYALEAGVCMGRPLCGLFWHLSFPLAANVAGLAIPRAAAVLAIAVFACAAWRVIRRHSPATDGGAAALAPAISLSPAFQVYGAWATCAPFPLAAFCGLWAGHLAAAIPPDAKRVMRIRTCVAAWLLLVAACLIYQPAAMFFWFAPALRLLWDERPGAGAARLVTRAFLIVIPALAASFVVFHWGNHHYQATGGLRGGVSLEPIGKIVWFLRDPLRGFVMPWILAPRTMVFLPFLVWLAGGLWLSDRGSPRTVITRFGMAGLLLVCAYIPNLVVAENSASYRTMGAPAAIGIVIAWRAFDGYVQMIRMGHKALPGLPLAFAIVCVALAHRHVSKYITRPQAAEWTFVREKVASAFVNERMAPPDILLVRPGIMKTLTPGVYLHEFGIPSTFYDWVPDAIVREAILANGRSPSGIHIESTKDPASGSLEEVLRIDVEKFIADNLESRSDG